MPLPHFLLMLAAVIISAGITLWLASTFGVPLFALGLLALMAAAIAHYAARDHHHH